MGGRHRVRGPERRAGNRDENAPSGVLGFGSPVWDGGRHAKPLPLSIMTPLSAVLLALAAAGGAAAGDAATASTMTPAHHPSGVSARRCGSAVYSCTPLAEGMAPAPPSTCVNLCVKGADPPRVPLPAGACGPPCTAPEEACVLAARAAAATVGSGGGASAVTADEAASPAPAAPPQFEAAFEAVRPGGDACPLLVV